MCYHNTFHSTGKGESEIFSAFPRFSYSESSAADSAACIQGCQMRRQTFAGWLVRRPPAHEGLFFDPIVLFAAIILQEKTAFMIYN